MDVLRRFRNGKGAEDDAFESTASLPILEDEARSSLWSSGVFSVGLINELDKFESSEVKQENVF